VLTLLSVLSNDNYLSMISVLCNDSYIHKIEGKVPIEFPRMLISVCILS
jgi:hypothetical protein